MQLMMPVFIQLSDVNLLIGCLSAIKVIPTCPVTFVRNREFPCIHPTSITRPLCFTVINSTVVMEFKQDWVRENNFNLFVSDFLDGHSYRTSWLQTCLKIHTQKMSSVSKHCIGNGTLADHGSGLVTSRYWHLYES